MARQVDHQRRAGLLDSAADYVIECGLADLSLRPMARELGVTPTTLVHHFGTKDQLLEAIIQRVRERILEAAHIEDRAVADPYRVIRDAWLWMTSPQHESLYRLYFEIYGSALQAPERFQSFLEHVVTDWLAILADVLERNGASPNSATNQATLAVAVVRGLLLDHLTTGDTERVSSAFETFLHVLQAQNRAGDG
ncbi:TetR/AcrR family transcriptional regulator [Streptomyces sp. 900116325]